MRPSLLAAAILALPLGAAAQPRGRDSSGESVTRYGEGAFEEEHLTGTRRSPEGDRVLVGGRRPYDTLLRIRVDFWRELTKSVENQ